jgi:hypothetical protein
MTPRDYVTQIWPDQSGHEGCAWASMASLMLSAGWESDAFGLYRQVQDQYGAPGQPVTLDQLAAALAAEGFTTQPWQGWAEAEGALARGDGVLCLLLNRLLLPRPYPFGAGWEAHHWLRLYGQWAGGCMALLYDPLCYAVQPNGAVYEGPTVATCESVRAAIRATPYPDSGLLVHREGTNLQGD